MSGTIEPPELVEDPGQQEQSSATEDRATEKRGHGTQEVGPAHSDADSAEDNLVSSPRVVFDYAVELQGSN